MKTLLFGCKVLSRAWLRIVSGLLLGTAFLAAALLWSQSGVPSPQFEQAAEAMRAGKLDTAATGFTAVIRQTPAFAEAHFNLGLVNEERGHYEEAITNFQKALALKPHLHGANLFLGITEFRLNHLDKAHAAVAKETMSYPKDASAWMWLGVVCLAQDKAEDAAEALDKAAKLNPNDEDIFYHRGRAHLLVSKNSYAHMFKLDSQSWLVHRVLAQANSEAERHTDAITEYEAAIKLAPTQPGLHEELGSEYRAVNKIEEAEAEFKKELEIDPHNILAKYKLGAIAVEKGDGTKGKELIEEAQRERPDLVHLDYNLGRAEMLLGHDEAATTHFERTVKTDTDPDVVEQAWYQLGTAYRRLHRIDEARNAMATYQQLKDEAAKKSQEKLERFRVDHPSVPGAPVPPQNPQ
ncbi:MAG: tetratricopeptide repeat protein [Candidatus Sulfotelmatobacter sp.]